MGIKRRCLNECSDALHQRVTIRHERLSKQANFARVRTNETEQHADRGGLSGAVWSEKAVDARRRNRQVKGIDGELCPETASQRPRFNQWVLYSHWRVNADRFDLLTHVTMNQGALFAKM